MTTPGGRGQRFEWYARVPGSGMGLLGRRRAELLQRRLHYQLERLAEQQGRLKSWLEFLQERFAPDAPPKGDRTAGGGRHESPYSGRMPPHGGSGAVEDQPGRREIGERSTAGDSEETSEEREGLSTGPRGRKRSSPRPPAARRKGR
jgi:hypothetical protein